MTDRGLPVVVNVEWRFAWRCLAVSLLAFASRGATALAEDVEQTTLVRYLRELYAADAAEYEIFRDAQHRESLKLRELPVYVWTNVPREQYGSVFVWTWNGRPEVVGSIFSTPTEVPGTRGVTHEFHSLSTAKLIPERESANRWRPRTVLQRQPLTDAPKPADTARERRLQLRQLARRFTARSIDVDKEQWELRLLPQPLYQYESTDPEIVDGALFAFVTSAGTDPEVMLLLEARRGDSGSEWTYAVCRFSNSDLFVSDGDRQVWSSVVEGDNTRLNDPQHLYRLMSDRRIEVVFSN